MSKLLAPNGKPSNLTPKQYKLVRTPAFKQWFGDWENSPETSSKVVDENGEPLVVYHGSNIDFNIFEKSKTNPYAEKQGYFFAFDKKYAESYNSKYVKPFFINIRIKGTFDDDDNLVPFNADGNIVQGLQVEVYDKKNIKLADGSNTTFDGNNPDIRFKNGGETKNKIMEKQMKINFDNNYAEGGEADSFGKGGNVSSIEKRVEEVNKLIELANANDISVIDSGVTWESPMKYKPVRYSNGVLYVEYQELDLYKYNRTGESNWVTKKDKVLKRNMEFDNPLNDIAKMYRKALREANIDYKSAELNKKEPKKVSEKEEGFDDAGTSMVGYYEAKGNFMIPKGQIYLWLYEGEKIGEKLQNEEYDYVFYPYSNINMAFQKGFIPPLKRIWTKKFQKDNKGSEHLLGVIKAYLIDKENGQKELYVDMMSVNPTKQKKGIMSYMIKELRDTFNLTQDQVTFSKLTPEGEKFVTKKTYADGGWLLINADTERIIKEYETESEARQMSYEYDGDSFVMEKSELEKEKLRETYREPAPLNPATYIRKDGGGVGEFPPKGELTNKDNFLLKYEKKGSDYEFIVYKPITKEVSGYNQIKHVCLNKDCPQKMNYEQFINYLYAELYLDDNKYEEGGFVGLKVRRKNLRGGYNNYEIMGYDEMSEKYRLKDLGKDLTISATTKELKNEFEFVDKYEDGGEAAEYQIIDKKTEKYYSLSMSDGKIKWNDSPDMGYMFTMKDANQIKESLLKTGYEQVEVVKYDSNWWKKAKYEKGGAIYPDLSLQKADVVNDSVELNEFQIKKMKNTFKINGMENTRIVSSQSAVKILRELFSQDTINAYEEAYILYLNKNNKVIGYYHHSSGGIDGTVMDVQMISGMALKSLAKGVIIAHNHPSENTQPSDADRKITNQLKDALKLFNIYLMDSIILTDDSFFSFSDDGLL